uniref:Uncharacterized protein n=1 Tax=Arundo donax TaxID=35708 RepID=A0A0A9HRM6_ARUDO
MHQPLTTEAACLPFLSQAREE